MNLDEPISRHGWLASKTVRSERSFARRSAICLKLSDVPNSLERRLGLGFVGVDSGVAFWEEIFGGTRFAAISGDISATPGPPAIWSDSLSEASGVTLKCCKSARDIRERCCFEALVT